MESPLASQEGSREAATVESILVAVIREFSADSFFFPPKTATERILVALRSGKSLGCRIAAVSSPELIDVPRANDSLFEDLADDATVQEGLEYISRSTRPRTASRVLASLRVLQNGGRLDSIVPGLHGS
jgi:hypothetical protein